ncbi:MAG: ABC transporter permease subunit [Christensenellales bacterium]|jgi:simple sugar transport system permease protein
MKTALSQKIVAGICFLLTLVLLVAGIWGLNARTQESTFHTLEKMRSYSVMAAAHHPLVELQVREASNKAYDYAQAEKYSRNQRRDYVAEQEKIARAASIEKLSLGFGLTSPGFEEAILALDAKLQSYYAALDAEEKAFLATKEAIASAPAAEETTAPEAGEDVALEAPIAEDVIRPVIDDLTGFAPSAALVAQKEAVSPQVDQLLAEISLLQPQLTPELLADARNQITDAVRAKGDNFETIYDRSLRTGADSVLTGQEPLLMRVVREAESLLYIAFGMLVLGLAILFFKPVVKRMGTPRFIILLFFLLLIVLAGLYDISVPSMITNILQRLGMYGVLVLAMLPGIQSGISLNMGMPIGIISGLLSTVIALEMNLTGWSALIFAVGVGILLAIPVGYAYGLLLNRIKGSEMTVSTYVGFSYVSLFCIFWMLLPFKNPKLTWALGSGLRVMHNMAGNIGGLLDNFLRFNVLGVSVPTGLLLFLFASCVVMYLFERSRKGVAMIAAGSNPVFAKASGINVDHMRLLGTTLSTVIASVGIIVYSQSFGFMSLYMGPQQMGFIAASAILIGGASITKAKVPHVILGTFLFQGVLALGIQVANAMINVSGLSEVIRILISNGIILYALTQAGGKGRD